MRGRWGKKIEKNCTNSQLVRLLLINLCTLISMLFTNTSLYNPFSKRSRLSYALSMSSLFSSNDVIILLTDGYNVLNITSEIITNLQCVDKLNTDFVNTRISIFIYWYRFYNCSCKFLYFFCYYINSQNFEIIVTTIGSTINSNQILDIIV